jgi:glycosyltransferase involved in cell wall biosynthesis
MEVESLANSVPRVSIGLPVYNGENYLAEAIRSVLGQTFPDLELIISDNASTDRTSEICRKYAAADQRVRYLRNEKNIGAALNYDLVWHKSTGTYFKWLAHDDRLLPNFVAATVSELESNRDAVLCNTVVDYIDQFGEHLGFYRSVIKDSGTENPAERFAAIILQMHTCVDFFGMIRREAMQNSLLHKAFRGSDRAFLAQMALRGRMLQLDEPLVQMRQHPEQYSQIQNVREQVAWMDPIRTGERELSILRIFRVYRQLIETESLSQADRQACRRVLRRFWIQGWSLGRLIAELLSIPFPRASSIFRAIAIKLKMSGAPRDFVPQKQPSAPCNITSYRE